MTFGSALYLFLIVLYVLWTILHWRYLTGYMKPLAFLLCALGMMIALPLVYAKLGGELWR